MVLSNGRRPGKSEWFEVYTWENCGCTGDAHPQLPSPGTQQTMLGWAFMPCESNCVVGASKHWALCCRIQGRAHRNVDAVREVRCTVGDGEYVGNAEQIRVGAPRQRGRDSGGRLKSKGECRESRFEKRGGQSRLSNWRLWGRKSLPGRDFGPTQSATASVPPATATMNCRAGIRGTKHWTAN